MKKATHDFLDTMFEGWLWAVVLAWLMFVGSRAGWRALPVVGLPLLCAYYLGSERGYRKWKKTFDAMVKEDSDG